MDSDTYIDKLIFREDGSEEEIRITHGERVFAYISPEKRHPYAAEPRKEWIEVDDSYFTENELVGIYHGRNQARAEPERIIEAIRKGQKEHDRELIRAFMIVFPIVLIVALFIAGVKS